jgi:hypothetical protein
VGIAVLIWVVFGIATALAAVSKGRSGCGWFALGVLLGPLGLILALVVAKNEPALEKQAVGSGAM